MSLKIDKIIIFIVSFILVFSNIVPVLALSFEDGQTINLKKDHDCIAVLKIQGEDKLKAVAYVCYEDPATGKKYPAFCVEPKKEGIGTGAADNYDVTLEALNDGPVWRALYVGYMGKPYQSWGLDCDDDLYYATKTAIHCLMDGTTPKGKYEVPNRVGYGDNISLEDVQLRGQKVLNVAEQIYYYAIESSDNYIKPEISAIKNAEQQEKTINNKNYILLTYKITSNRPIDSYNVNIQSFPTGTLILNSEEKTTNTIQGETFKVAIPKDKLTANIKGTVKIENAISKTYPVFYATAYDSKYQNYVIYADKEEALQCQTITNIDVHKSKLTVIKNGEAEVLEGVKFTAKYLDNNEKIGDFVTNKNGEIIIKGLRQGKISLTETETKDEYILPDKPFEIEIGYNESKNYTITNNRKKGEIEITKVDKDDNTICLEGVEFELISKEGKVVANLKTDAKGKAVASNIDIGEYTLKETKTKAEYKTCADKSVKINWNEKLELKIENEKKKGKIKVIKQDKENNEIKLASVKFDVINGKGEIVETLVTNSVGEATTKDLPIGKYTIKEISTNSKYILDETPITINVKENEITTQIVNNERKKGSIKIIKTSSDENKITKTEAGSPIEGAKFNIYNSSGKIMDTVTTNKEGIAISKKLDLGNYKVKEAETAKWYILNDKSINVEIKENEQIIECKLTNDPHNPSVNIEKNTKNTVQSNGEIDYEFNIENNGNVKLQDFTWYDNLPYEKAKITKISTGTYNQELKYSIYYKTNQKDQYMVIKKDISTKENSYIDLSNINLENEEKITEIKVCFGEVKAGFKNLEKPHIYMKVNENLENDTIIKNYTILEGYDGDYKVSDEDIVTTTVYNIIEKKKLPRTGF